MALGGGALLILGKALSPWSPINKTLWSPSYVLFMAGWAMVIFSAFHFLVDVKGRRTWAKPLVIYGSNAILVYMLSCALTRLAELIKFSTAAGPVSVGAAIFNALCHVASPINASALYAVGNVAVLFLPVWYLFRKGWFLKV
jgi:predicted acyltransferase